MQLQPKPRKLQVYDGIKVIATSSPTLTRTHTLPICKGLRPALPVHHTTVVLHHSYPAAVHMPSTSVYIYPDGYHWLGGTITTIGCV